ncbi:MAG: type II toxin-antitoxin system VapC family toxin [Chloroflexi bacterium]|nr:type II toxin-antitoxin system VapC family toxin [Chloroflexota bacterium]
MAFEDEANLYADAVLAKLAETSAVVPSIWPLEAVNVLLVAERRKRLKQADSARFITLLSQLPIFVEREWPENRMEKLLAAGLRGCFATPFDDNFPDRCLCLRPLREQFSSLSLG